MMDTMWDHEAITQFMNETPSRPPERLYPHGRPGEAMSLAVVGMSVVIIVFSV